MLFIDWAIHIMCTSVEVDRRQNHDLVVLLFIIPLINTEYQIYLNWGLLLRFTRLR